MTLRLEGPVRRATACALASLLAATVPAPTEAREPVAPQTLAAIRAEARTHHHIMETAAHLCDVIGPRLTGSPQYRAATAWTAQRLEEWGIPHVTTETWGPFGPIWSPGPATLILIEPEHTSLIAYPKPWSPRTTGSLRGDAVHVILQTDADLARHRGALRGKIVLLDGLQALPLSTTTSAHRHSEAELAELAKPRSTSVPREAGLDLERARFEQRRGAFLASEGVLATLEVGRRSGGTVLVAQWTDAMPPSASGPQLPSLVVASEHYNRLVRLLAGGHRVTLEVDVATRLHEDQAMIENVVAEIPGTDRADEVVILGAHLDSWHGGCGATDNAAGVAVAMEAMRILHKATRPRRTVRLGLWGGEEQGLLGSRAHVARHYGWRDEPEDAARRALPFFMRPFDGLLHRREAASRVQLYLNADYGTGRIRGVFLQSGLEAAPLFEAWLAPLRDLDATTVSPRLLEGTDHQSFESVGIPAFAFIHDDLEYFSRTHHTNMDTLERLREQDLIQAATVVASIAIQAANSPMRVPPPRLPEP